MRCGYVFAGIRVFPFLPSLRVRIGREGGAGKTWMAGPGYDSEMGLYMSGICAYHN